MSIHVFGIRHHGPGCARSLIAALEELRPDVLVLEAPADLEAVLPFAAEEDMRPPVAMLVYPHDAPRRSVVYPLALFSPEWQSLRWAFAGSVPVRAMDLPMAHRLALDDLPSTPVDEDSASDGGKPVSPGTVRADPLALLAEAAGYQDHELWWEEQIERRQDATHIFAAILDAMRAVREEFPEVSQRDLLRESFMRKTIRAVVKQGFQRIAVICGAWHSPVLDEPAIAGKRPGCKVKEDTARLKGLPKLKTVATWIPWTHSRLAYRSGYGAGIESPGWYAHLWESRDAAPARWLVQAAQLLREKDLSASSADLIEAHRLADALAALRDLCSPGLRELNESILSVLCHGDEAPLRLIRRRLEIGDRLGIVPANIRAVPLAEDLKQLQKSLRLKPSAETRLLDLDLRNDVARERSKLLHRLCILGISWGEPQPQDEGISTFHEIWQLRWEPEFAIAVIEANVWGNTVETAAAARLIDRSRAAIPLPELTSLLDAALRADLPQAVSPIIERMQSSSAVSTDVVHLMQALPGLAGIQRYGNVRGSAIGLLEPMVTGIVERILVGLPAATAALDDSAAERMLEGFIQTEQALPLLQQPRFIDEWTILLQRLTQLHDRHGLLRGWACRTLLERGVIDAVELDSLTRQALSPGTPTPRAAAWMTGLLRGSGLMLLQNDIVWQVMDGWLVDMEEDRFIEALPLLRRAFSSFSLAQRRQMGSRIKTFSVVAGEPPSHSTAAMIDINHDRAGKVLPVLARILGVRHD